MTIIVPGTPPSLECPEPLSALPGTSPGTEIDYAAIISKLCDLCMVVEIGSDQRQGPSSVAIQALSLLAHTFKQAAEKMALSPTPAIDAWYKITHQALVNVAKSELPISMIARCLLMQFDISSTSRPRGAMKSPLAPFAPIAVSPAPPAPQAA